MYEEGESRAAVQYIFICTCMHTYIHIYMHTQKDEDISMLYVAPEEGESRAAVQYICIHTYIHTCIHTYIHTYIQKDEVIRSA
jgi:hypothetical protein